MSIFSTQNLQTFFFRKYCRLQRRGPPGPPPGPPGPASRRGPPCPPPECPPPECPVPECPPPPGAGAVGAAACLISSAMHFHPFSSRDRSFPQSNLPTQNFSPAAGKGCLGRPS